MSVEEKLKKAAMLLFAVSDLLDDLCRTNLVNNNTLWNEKMPEMETQTCCFASDLAEFYGVTYICNEIERVAV